MNDEQIVREMSDDELLQQLKDLEYFESKGGFIPPPVINGLNLIREELKRRELNK